MAAPTQRGYPATGTTQACTPATCTQIVWKQVPGQEVFAVCVFLIIACLIWLGMWLHKGVKFEAE